MSFSVMFFLADCCAICCAGTAIATKQSGIAMRKRDMRVSGRGQTTLVCRHGSGKVYESQPLLRARRSAYTRRASVCIDRPLRADEQIVPQENAVVFTGRGTQRQGQCK